MRRSRSRLREEFAAWGERLEDIETPQWARSDQPERWLEQAADAELESLSAWADDTRTTRPQGGLLVLVAGTSPQPCLLSALWRQPERIIVACSEDGGEAYAERLEGALRAASMRLERPFTVLRGVSFPSTDPVQAFARLRERLEQHYRDYPDDRTRTVLDLTGGKKPMVSAAFFLAAWRDIPSVYIDSDYDPRARLPKPCTAKPVELGNPGIALGLYALREARRLWEAHAYRAADELLGVACQQIGGGDPRLVGEIDRARQLAHGVMAWEELRYDFAEEAASERMPRAVLHLAKKWRSIRKKGQVQDPRSWEGELRNAPWHLMLHLVDVLRWVRRRHDRDQRARYLRLYAVGETAIVLALAHAWKSKTLRAEPSPAGSFSGVWRELRRVGAAVLLADGIAEGEGRTWEVPAIPEAGPWKNEERRELRNAAAHGLAIVEPSQVDELLVDVEKLLRAVARWVGTAKNQDGREVPLSEELQAWLAEDCRWFEPPPFPIAEPG